MSDDLWQQRLPAFHVQVERRAERFRVHFDNRVEAVFSRLAEFCHPLRLQIFNAERAVAIRPWLDGDQMQNVFQPARDPVTVARFDVRGENAAMNFEIIIQPGHAWIN
jgi:hypothetical protein